MNTRIIEDPKGSPNGQFQAHQEMGLFGYLGAFCFALFGICFLFFSIWVIARNEFRLRQKILGYGEARSKVVPAILDRVQAGNEGKLVYLSGTARAEGIITDPVFGIATRAIVLKRWVEMFQWVQETRSRYKSGSRNTEKYRVYEREWRANPVNSTFYPKDRKNPPMPFVSATMTAPKVLVGAYDLPKRLIRGFTDFAPITVTSLPAANFPEGFALNMVPLRNCLYFGQDPNNPEIGDLKVTFSLIQPDRDCSFVSCQHGSTFVPFRDRLGNDFELFMPMKLELDDLMKKAPEEFSSDGTAFRWFGVIMTFIAAACCLRPVQVFLGRHPIIQPLFRFGILPLGMAVGTGIALSAIVLFNLFYQLTLR